MTKQGIVLVGAALALLALAACSGDGTFGPDFDTPAQDTRTVVANDLAPSGADFSITIPDGGTANHPVAGPLVLFGRNLRVDEATGGLLVDLSVLNGGDLALPEPVGLTFTELLPAGAAVLNADNGETGAGAAIAFGFVNDDTHWTPGEESLPRTVLFALPEGGAVAFRAHINAGAGPLTGAIGGMVFQDLDADGVQDPDEGPAAGIRVVVVSEPEPAPALTDSLPPVVVREAFSGADGRYLVGGLPAGFYAVHVEPPLPSTVTTPMPLYVTLADEGGVIGSFDGADFGVDLVLPDVVVIDAAADATVRADLDSRMNDNYGCDPYVAVGRGRDGAPDRIRGLVRFDVPLFFRDAPLLRASLVMQVGQFRDGAGQVYDLGVHAVAAGDSLENWIEGNGSEHPGDCEWVDAAYGVAWIGAGDGGDANNQTQPRFAADAAATLQVTQAATPDGALLTWDVTDLVSRWLAGESNYGIVIRDVSAAGSFRSLWLVSNEGAAAGLGAAPRLELEFAPPPELR